MNEYLSQPNAHKWWGKRGKPKPCKVNHTIFGFGFLNYPLPPVSRSLVLVHGVAWSCAVSHGVGCGYVYGRTWCFNVKSPISEWNLIRFDFRLFYHVDFTYVRTSPLWLRSYTSSSWNTAVTHQKYLGVTRLPLIYFLFNFLPHYTTTRMMVMYCIVLFDFVWGRGWNVCLKVSRCGGRRKFLQFVDYKQAGWDFFYKQYGDLAT